MSITPLSCEISTSTRAQLLHWTIDHEVTKTGRKAYAELDGIPGSELVAGAPNAFAAKSKQMKMIFTEDPTGFVIDVVITCMAPKEEKG